MILVIESNTDAVFQRFRIMKTVQTGFFSTELLHVPLILSANLVLTQAINRHGVCRHRLNIFNLSFPPRHPHLIGAFEHNLQLGLRQ